MITELIASKERPSVGLKVKVSSVDMEFPRSEEEMEAALTSHVVRCRHCLAAALFRQETLAEVGCADYRQMLERAHAVLRVRQAVEAGAHVDEDSLEEYCFNRLSAEQSERLEEHIVGCPYCAEQVEDRLEFIACMKDALSLLEQSKQPEGLSGAMAVRCPDRDLNIYAAVGR